jgi:hypothetical protein
MKNASTNMNVTRRQHSRSGIALMVTVGIIALISVVVLGNLELLEDAQQQTLKAKKFNQSQAILKSFEKLLVKQSSQITSADTLEVLLVSVQGLIDENALLELDVQISSLQGKININAIFGDRNSSVDPNYELMFGRLFDKYELKDGNLMLALIADTIDLDRDELNVNSELVNLYADFSQGAIYSQKHLDKLVDYYNLLRGDENVYNIPWDLLFYFGKPHVKGILDCNHMSGELAEYTGLNLSYDESEYQQVSCQELTADHNETKNAFNMQEFSKDENYKVEVLAEYTALNVHGTLAFIYDIKTKGISHIRSY